MRGDRNQVDLDSIRGQLDEAAATERAVNIDRTGRLEAIEVGMIDSTARIQHMEQLLAENNAETRANALQALAAAETLQTVHEMLNTWRAGMNALDKFGRGLALVGRWVLKVVRVGGIVATGVLAIWALILTILHNGRPPSP